MSQASFDAYNTFLVEADLDRFTKILCRYEHFKEVLDRPGDIVECGVFKGQGLLFWAKMIQIFNPLSPRRVIGRKMPSGGSDVSVTVGVSVGVSVSEAVGVRVEVAEAVGVGVSVTSGVGV